MRSEMISALARNCCDRELRGGWGRIGCVAVRRDPRYRAQSELESVVCKIWSGRLSERKTMGGADHVVIRTSGASLSRCTKEGMAASESRCANEAVDRRSESFESTEM